MKLRALGLFIGIALLAPACGDDVAPGSGPTSTLSDTPTESADGDDCTQGGAFADDVEFRQAVCRPYLAMVELIGDGEIDPEWSQRITEAILNYADDRAGALTEVRAVLAEIEAAAN